MPLPPDSALFGTEKKFQFRGCRIRKGFFFLQKLAILDQKGTKNCDKLGKGEWGSNCFIHVYISYGCFFFDKHDFKPTLPFLWLF